MTNTVDGYILARCDNLTGDAIAYFGGYPRDEHGHHSLPPVIVDDIEKAQVFATHEQASNILGGEPRIKSFKILGVFR